jgi:hypothetical protein
VWHASRHTAFHRHFCGLVRAAPGRLSHTEPALALTGTGHARSGFAITTAPAHLGWMHEVTSEQVDVSAMQDPEAAATINHRRIHVLFNIQVRRHGRPVPRPVRYTLRLSSTSCRRRVFRRNRGIALTRFVPNVVSVPIAPPVSACSPVRADDHGDPWRKMSVAGAGLYARRAQRDLRPPRSADTGSPPACVLKKGERSDHLKGALHCCHRIRTLAMKRELLRCMGRLVRAF